MHRTGHAVDDHPAGRAAGDIFRHPDRDKHQFEGIHRDGSGSVAQPNHLAVHGANGAAYFLYGLFARLQRGVRHGSLIHFGRPARQKARVVGRGHREIEPRQHFIQQAGEFVRSRDDDIVEIQGLRSGDGDEALVLIDLSAPGDVAHHVERPHRQVERARDLDLAFRFDMVFLHPGHQPPGSLALVETQRQDGIGRRQFAALAHHVHRAAVGAGGADLFRTKDELGPAAFAGKDLRGHRLAVPLAGGHGHEEILLIGGLAAPQGLRSLAEFAHQGDPVGSIDHAPAAFRAGETVGAGIHRPGLGRGHVVGVDDVLGLELPIQDGEAAPGGGVGHVQRQHFFEIIALGLRVVGQFAQIEIRPGTGLIVVGRLEGTLDVIACSGKIARFKTGDAVAQEFVIVIGCHSFLLFSPLSFNKPKDYRVTRPKLILRFALQVSLGLKTLGHEYREDLIIIVP